MALTLLYGRAINDTKNREGPMKKLELLAALAMAAATPAIASAMNSGRETAPQACVRRVDARGNVRVICPDVRSARAAWTARGHDHRGNYVVYYNHGKQVREWRHEIRHDRH
jgi:hypothetical protein